MRPTLKTRGFGLFPALLLLCCAWSAAQPEPDADGEPETVESLRYGVTLFHYFQQDYFNALTELMAASRLDALAGHRQRAELLRGGMSLSYGMDHTAQGIFTDFLSRYSQDPSRDRAWFFLAKMAWQRGDMARSQSALERLSDGFEGPLAEESVYLQAALALRQQDFMSADAAASSLADGSVWRAYASVNRGAAEAARGRWSDASMAYRELGQMPLFAEESLKLRDRAFAASGFALLAVERYAAAREDFVQVRLQSPEADRALLGLGWAEAGQGNYLAALAPWQRLSEQPYLNAAVREGLLAVPYAYTQLQREALALQHYQQAATRYREQLQALRAARAQLAGEGSAALFAEVTEQPGSWRVGEDLFPHQRLAGLLQDLVIRNDYQQSARDLADLLALSGHMALASERLAVLAQVDTDQQEVWSGLQSGEQREQLQARREQLADTLQALQRRFDSALAQRDGRALADAEQAALWQRLDRVQARIGSSGESLDPRSRIIQGLLIWEDTEQAAEREWRLQRELQRLQTALQRADQGLLALDAVIQRRQQGSFAERIAALQTALTEQQQSLGNLIARAEGSLRETALAELDAQERAVVSALGRSQLAIAQLYDRAAAPGIGPQAAPVSVQEPVP